MRTRMLPADAAGIAQAAALLRGGLLVAFGTETVYGLGADATNARAVTTIFAAKGRPRFNPLICHFADAESAFAHVEAEARARKLADAFWPGPLTMVLPRRVGSKIDLLVSAGLDTIAVRVPAHDAARVLLRVAGVPVAAPSANRSGGVSPTTAAHVFADLDGSIDAVMDSGPAGVGLESTVLDLSAGDAVLLRPGGVSREAIEAVIGPVRRHEAGAGKVLKSPGLLASHYAPELPLRLHGEAGAAEALLAFGPAPAGAGLTWNLSESADLAEAASRLFAGLRWLDSEGRARGLRAIVAMSVPSGGLGDAINDRLERARKQGLLF
jgi:L-threonylcarbamoyladenylate synthase